jgi:chromosome segregation ATPase
MANRQETELARLEAEFIELKVKEEVCQRTAHQYGILVPKLQRDFADAYTSLNDAAQKLGAARKEWELFREKRARLRAKIRALEDRQAAASRAFRDAGRNINDLQREYQTTTQNVERLSREMRADREALSEKEREVEDVNRAIGRERARRYPDRHNLSVLEQTLSQKQERLDARRGDLEEKRRRKVRDERRLEALRMQIDAAQPDSADMQKLDDELAHKRTKLQTLEQDLRRSELALTRAQSDMTDARARNHGARPIEELNTLIRLFEGESAAAEAQRISKGQALRDKRDDLRRQREQGGRDGAERMQKIKDLVAELSYCRESMKQYNDRASKTTIRRTPEQRQQKLERVYSKLEALVRDQ